ncbi:hypothetical protein GQX74_013068 [Glossina fuscipes]|nr:hypothetical protein GQX74_013068 [Glossina fuscipes]
MKQPNIIISKLSSVVEMVTVTCRYFIQPLGFKPYSEQHHKSQGISFPYGIWDCAFLWPYKGYEAVLLFVTFRNTNERSKKLTLIMPANFPMFTTTVMCISTCLSSPETDGIFILSHHER